MLSSNSATIWRHVVLIEEE